MTGKQLRQIRLQMELSQRQLAAHIRTTRNTIARWERGEVQISEPIGLLIEMVAKEHGVDAAHPARGRRHAQNKRAHAKAAKTAKGKVRRPV
jgi:transcriptional regulator with XRE-family HTH domain